MSWVISERGQQKSLKETISCFKRMNQHPSRDMSCWPPVIFFPAVDLRSGHRGRDFFLVFELSGNQFHKKSPQN